MRKADIITKISDKTGVPKVDVLVSLEAFFKEIKDSLENGENVYIRGFGSFITKKRAKKIGRNIKKNIAIEIPAHFIPVFKPAKVFVESVKTSDFFVNNPDGPKSTSDEEKSEMNDQTTNVNNTYRVPPINPHSNNQHDDR